MPLAIKLKVPFGMLAAFAVLLGAVCGNTVSVSAQSGDAWFGLDMPKMREQQSREDRTTYQNPDIAPLSLKSPEPGDLYLNITGEDVHRFLQDIMNVTDQYRPKGERFWGRIAGSRAEIETGNYMAQKFKEFGLKEVRTEPVQGGKQWWPLDWEVTLIGHTAYGSETKDVTLTSAFPALQLKTGALSVLGLEAELVHVGRGHMVDFLGRDVTGKIAVMHAALQPNPFFQSARGHVENAIDAGAVGVLTVMDAPGNHQYALEDMGPPDVPSFLLGGDDGRFLEGVMAAAGSSNPLKVRISLEAEVRESWRGNNVLGLIPGQSDEYIVLIAHLDGYFHSANDNGAGLASLLALAQHYSRSGARQLKRNLLFVGTSGHHEFSDGAEALMANYPEIMEKTVLVFNIEHPSSVMSYFRGPLKFHNRISAGQLMSLNTEGIRTLTISNGNPLLVAFFHEAIDYYGLVVNSLLRRQPSGDASGFYRAGHTVVQIPLQNLWYHSSGDRIDTIQASGLERATRLYAFVLDKIDGVSRADLERSAP